LVEDLSKTPVGEKVLPEGFLEVWQSFKTAMAGGEVNE